MLWFSEGKILRDSVVLIPAHELNTWFSMHVAVNSTPEHSPVFAPKADPRALKILSRTLFKDLQNQGLTDDQIIALATQLLGHVTESIKDKRPL